MAKDIKRKVLRQQWLTSMYCEIKAECRRQTLLKHFGESFDRRDCKYGSSPCDNCLKTVFKLVLRIESNEGIKRSERQTNSRKKPKAKQKKNKQMFDAMKPKKSPFTGSSFSFLRKDLHKEFQEQNPDIKSMYDIGKACGEKWKTMTFENASSCTRFARTQSESNRRNCLLSATRYVLKEIDQAQMEQLHKKIEDDLEVSRLASIWKEVDIND
ncbi:high mobility group B protein 4-like [Glycine soja]|uniref:high mobility group B protein 4-like n=1 Tax=Glycine soja TaxID=3848 RepID=UPI00103D41CC|nr:high mobility group B protein 4-like [Glycine soja]